MKLIYDPQNIVIKEHNSITFKYTKKKKSPCDATLMGWGRRNTQFSNSNLIKI